MSKIIIVSFSLLLLHTIAVAQNTSKWTIELATSYRVNKAENLKGLGALMSRNIKGDFWLQTGVLYKSQKEKLTSVIITDYQTIENDIELRLEYIGIPLMLMYKGNFLNLGIGTNYERFLNSKDLSNTPLIETSASPEKKNKWYLTGYMGHAISISSNIRIEPGVSFNYRSQKVFTDINLSFKYIL